MEYRVSMSAAQTIPKKRNAAAVSEANAKQAVYPFRILAVLLSLVILVEFIGIMRLPDLSGELAQARQELQEAEAEHARLVQELEQARSMDTVEGTARDEYGYTYYGEVIYVPVFEGQP